jgi:hypothetical protein
MRKRQSQAKAERRNKVVQALGLRASGASYKQIGQVLGVSEPTAWRLVQQESANLISESAQEVLELELQRLDRLQLGLWAKAINGDVYAVDRVLRIMEQRAKLLGLYDRAPEPEQPTQQGVVVIQGDTSEDYIRGLQAMRGIGAPLPLPPSNGNGHRETPS